MENQKPSAKRIYWKEGMICGIYTISKIEEDRCTVICNRCGFIKEVSKHYLSALSKQEYCLNCKPKTSKKYQPGQILGNVYELQEFLGGNNWKVKCIKCGKIQIQSVSNMKRHKKDTCTYCNNPYYDLSRHKGGGAACKLSFDERFYNYYKSRVDSWNKSEKKKYKTWNLTVEDISKLIHGNCYYCGAEPSEDNQWNKKSKRRTEDTIIRINGIDRVNSDIGYEPGNCVSCCPICNTMKSDLTVEEFKNHIKKLYNRFFSEGSTTISVGSSDPKKGTLDNINSNDDIV